MEELSFYHGRMRAVLWILVPALLAAGDLTDRYQLVLNRVLGGGPPAYTEELVLADAVPRPIRRFTNFSGDVSGRYIGALASVEAPRLPGLISDLIRLQKPDGHFGDPMNSMGVVDDDMARLWGNGRLLIGLLESYRSAPNPEVLGAARRLGDFLVRVAPVFNEDKVRQDYELGAFAVGYICWTQNIEGLAELYRVTGEARYLRVAEQMAARTGMQPAQHSHGFLTSVRGIVELYRATHDERFLRQAEQGWKEVGDSGNVLVQGAVPEAFAPRIRRDEGCSEADWLRLSLALWQLTRRTEYLEAAEWTLFNEFAFNQFRSGDFGHHELTATGAGYAHARAWWCCTLHGLRAFRDVFDAVFHGESGTLFYDLAVDGRGKVEGLAARASSSLGRDGQVSIEIVESDGKPRTVAVRQPSWARNVNVSLNGAAVEAQERNGYLRIERGWKPGDKLAIHYSLRTRAVRRNDEVALSCGPWLLGVDAELSSYFFDEPHEENRIVLRDVTPTGDVHLDPARERIDAAAFAVPVAHFTLDYIPGGYTDQRQTMTLRPIAENTTLADGTAWEFWLR